MAMFLTTSLIAQPNKNKRNFDRPRGDKFMHIPDLTDAQKTEIKKLRTALMSDMLPLRNQLRELQAHRQTISTGDNVNMKDVYKNIDDISAVKTKMAKKRADHRQAVRKLLTKDQRVIFDMHRGRKHKRGKGMRSGRHGHKGNFKGRNCNF